MNFFIKLITLGILCLLFSMTSFGFSQSHNNIKKLYWKGIPVIWLEDNRFPTYTISFYFADGALSDRKGLYGETNATFSLLTSGTKRFNQKQITDSLEFYGTSYSADVVHEYSTYSISGLVKDIIPTIKMVCHLFRAANFPKKELRNEKRRARNSLMNLINSHRALANRAFRQLSLSQTVYNWPVSGTYKSLGFIKRKHLLDKLNYFTKKVFKRIYITGPSGALIVKEIISNDCGMTNPKDGFIRTVKSNYKSGSIGKKPKIYLVRVPKATQAQIRVGRFLNSDEIGNIELLELLSGFLGSGFTSRLFQEIRVKRGLTYSIGAFAAGQKYYGRAGIYTFTKNESVIELLKVLNNTLLEVSQGKFEDSNFMDAKNYLIGSYPFKFELGRAYLNKLIFLDHIERDYNELFRFTDRIKLIQKDQIMKINQEIFDWNKQIIVILGPKSLIKRLKQAKEFGPVKVFSYKKFL